MAVSHCFSSDFIVLENYGYDPSGDRLDVFETVSQKCAGAEGNANSRLSVLVSSPIDSYKNHLLALLRAQSRIMAYRVNKVISTRSVIVYDILCKDI